MEKMIFLVVLIGAIQVMAHVSDWSLKLGAVSPKRWSVRRRDP